MKVMVISFFFILFSSLLPFVSALDFNISNPEEVEMNESFEVNIEAETSDVYDVKVFVNEPIKEYSEMFYDGEWKSPHFYLTSAFPSEKEFTIRVYVIGEYEICARLRKTGTDTTYTNCNNITIIENPNPPEEEPEENISEDNSQNNSSVNETEEDNSQSEEDEEEIEYNNQSAIQPAQSVKSSSANLQSSLQEDSEVIYLNKKSPSNPVSNTSFMTKDEKIRLWMAYGFAGLCILILLFVFLRKL